MNEQKKRKKKECREKKKKKKGKKNVGNEKLGKSLCGRTKKYGGDM